MVKNGLIASNICLQRWRKYENITLNSIENKKDANLSAAEKWMKGA